MVSASLENAETTPDDVPAETPEPEAQVETPDPPPETEDTPVAEPEAEVSTESVEETPDVGNLSDDELEELPNVKSLLARRSESVRQKAELATAQQVSQARNQMVLSGEARQGLENIAAKAAANPGTDGLAAVDQKEFNTFYDAVIQAGMSANTNASFQAVAGSLPKDFANDEENRDFQRAYTLVAQNPSDPSPLIEVGLKVHDRHLLLEAEKDLTKTIETKVRKEFDTKAANGETQRARTKNQSEGGPTPVSGDSTAGKVFQTFQAAENAYAEGDLSHTEYKKLRVAEGLK